MDDDSDPPPNNFFSRFIECEYYMLYRLANTRPNSRIFCWLFLRWGGSGEGMPKTIVVSRLPIIVAPRSVRFPHFLSTVQRPKASNNRKTQHTTDPSFSFIFLLIHSHSISTYYNPTTTMERTCKCFGEELELCGWQICHPMRRCRGETAEGLCGHISCADRVARRQWHCLLWKLIHVGNVQFCGSCMLYAYHLLVATGKLMSIRVEMLGTKRTTFIENASFFIPYSVLTKSFLLPSIDR